MKSFAFEATLKTLYLFIMDKPIHVTGILERRETRVFITKTEYETMSPNGRDEKQHSACGVVIAE